MKLLEDRIARDGKIESAEILKVNSFLNHQIDPALIDELGKEFYRLFKDDGITKILTVEASGIPIAYAAAREFGIPFVFAKKEMVTADKPLEKLTAGKYYAECHSFTKKYDYVMTVQKDFLSECDRILVIDDFLANGAASRALTGIIAQSGATLCGIGIAIEKGFQPGGDELRKKGIHLESLAIVESMEPGKIVFRS